MRFRDALEMRERIPSGCAISGFINRDGRLETGERIIKSITLMHDRSNGLGGGFSAYGIYPRYSSYYAFHMMYDSEEAKTKCEEFLNRKFHIVKDEPIPTRGNIPDHPILWRYFLEVPEEGLEYLSEDEYTARAVSQVHRDIPGAFVSSSGKNMGSFKGVGYPEDIAEFYKIERYRAYTWIAHGRFPTNTPGWWGGAHPFSLLEWSVVHNGEIASYGINRRYLEEYGYKLALRSDTEVITYLIDFLARRNKIPLELVPAALAPPFWSEIDRMEPRKRRLYTAIRAKYGSALLNGPFSIILGFNGGMMGLNDRIKLRPLTAAEKGQTLYIATEESAIREIEPSPDRVWQPRGGEPVIGRLTLEVIA